jgi:hypothetical protein
MWTNADIFVQVAKVLVALWFLYMTIRGVRHWQRQWPTRTKIYLAATAVMALITIWSLLSHDIFSGVTRSVNDTITLALQLLALITIVIIPLSERLLEKKQPSDTL